MKHLAIILQQKYILTKLKIELHLKLRLDISGTPDTRDNEVTWKH